jgi:NodT family efflux transporter outer membrane factor (OMF) lipoprotein
MNPHPFLNMHFKVQIRLTKWFTLIAITGLLTACSIQQAKISPVDVPKTWTDAQSLTLVKDPNIELQKWWESFEDPTLNQLISHAATGNYDIKIATQRLIQARALRDYNRGALQPQVSLTPQLSRSQTGYNWAEALGLFNTFNLGFDVTWEADIFGGLRLSVQAAENELQSSAESRRDTMVSLLAEVAMNYANLRSAQIRVSIVRKNIDVAKESLRLTKLQYDRGLISDLNLAKSQAQYENVQSSLQPLLATIDSSINSLALLLGTYSNEIKPLLEKQGSALNTPSRLPLELPSEVMRNRPDIRQAERKLAAALDKVGIAHTNYFPSFQIPLSIGYETTPFGLLFNPASLIWSYGLNITQPIFQGGRLDAQLSNAEANAEASRLSYEKSVHSAFSEVETAMSGYKTQRNQVVSLSGRVNDFDVIVNRSKELYKRGLKDYLSVLSSESDLYAAQNNLEQSRLQEITYLFTLYKALGGGWQMTEHIETQTQASGIALSSANKP